MSLKAAVLVALLVGAGPTDAPTGAFVARTVTVDVPDAGTVTVGDGGVTGCWLDTGTCVVRARERLEMQERVRLSEAQDAKHHAEATTPLLLALTAGFAIGLTLGVAVVGLNSPTQPSP